MTKRYKLAVLIGRFEPFHNGHLANVKQALDLADEAIVLIGSSYQPRTPKNPFSFYERADMIRGSVNSDRMGVHALRDHKYSNNSWIREVQATVHRDSPDIDDSDIAILGFDKDESSWYNHAFPNWEFIGLKGFVAHGGNPIDATKVRELFFEGHLDYIQGAVPTHVFNALKDWKTTEYYEQMVEEYKFYRDYDPKKFPCIMHTTDAVVLQGGHILLIERGHSPGKGLWALPGGFLNPRETLEDGVIRELREETKIKVPEIVLRKGITYDTKFDHPDRDLRGRVLTQAYLIELDGGNGELPRVKGSDDARVARWFTLAEIAKMGEVMYGDHAHIIETMVARAKK
jgi:bifunctional NMN adenylyltransferase/nudix hydrolase